MDARHSKQNVPETNAFPFCDFPSASLKWLNTRPQCAVL